MFPDHHCYVDVFGGAGNVLIQKPASKVEVFNDINSDIYNLFKTLQDRPDDFYYLISHTPYSRECFYDYKEKLKHETDELERAVMWYAIACQSFGGNHGSAWGTGKTKNYASTFKKRVGTLDVVIDRLRSVIIENNDFDVVLDAYDGKDTFFYLDPPYLPETRKPGKCYKHEMSYEDHERLINKISTIDAKVMLSGYRSDLYDSLNWEMYELDTYCHVVAKTRKTKIQGEGVIHKNHKRVECVYINYTLPIL